MSRRVTIGIGVALAATAIAGGGVAIAVNRAGDDGTERDVAITGEPLARASAAALAHTGEGRVTGTEIGDEESYYEVEVTLDDGRQVDVQLDRDFAVVGAAADHEDTGADD